MFDSDEMNKLKKTYIIAHYCPLGLKKHHCPARVSPGNIANPTSMTSTAAVSSSKYSIKQSRCFNFHWPILILGSWTARYTRCEQVIHLGGGGGGGLASTYKNVLVSSPDVIFNVCK